MSFGLSEAYAATLTNVERTSLQYAYEVGTVVSRDAGEILAQQALGKTGGGLEPAVLKAMENNTFTHNHPSGGPLGYKDMDTAIRFGAAEFRAVGPEATKVLDLTGLPTQSRDLALAALTEIRVAEQTAFEAAHPSYKSYSPDALFKASSQVLENIAQQLANRFQGQIKYTTVPTPK